MADSVVLTAQKRQGRGSRLAERLRKQGQVPAVIYGHKEETISLTLPRDTVLHALRHGARVVDLQMEGRTEKALITEVQWDHLGKEILHLDFRRTSADERIQVPVAIELRGVAPGVTAGGVLDQPIHSLTVECLAVAIPESIRVNINELQVGGAIHVRDLHLPEGVQALADPDAIVVHVTTPQAEPEPGAAPTAEQAEPERIGRQRPAEEGAEEGK